MREAVIINGCRTAIGNFGGSLRTVPAIELGSIVIRSVLEKSLLKPEISSLVKNFIPEKLKKQGLIQLENKISEWPKNYQSVHVDEVIMGNVLQASQGQNPARQASIRSGIPKETPAFTVNKVCGSGLKAIALGASSIITGESDVVIAGGMENMSLSPMALTKARWGHRMELSGKGEIYDLMVFDGLYEIFYGYHMGFTAENIAEMYRISRYEQDELSLLSHSRSRDAIEKGLFDEEIIPVHVKSKKQNKIINLDERPMDTTLERLSKLNAVFKKNGTVTAGNSSGINDGAAAVLLMSADKAMELGLNYMVKIRSFRSGGVDPAYMGLGPIPAIKSVLNQVGITINDIDMIELNEAFASQAIGCMRELGIKKEKVNKLGSGISLGHPIGCTGARQMVTAIHQMNRNNYKKGLISMCIGGGMGMAMMVES